MTTRPFPINSTLTAIAIAYRNPATTLIGRRVLPPLPVLSESFKWLLYNLAEGFTLPNTLVARKGKPDQVEFTATEQSSAVLDYGLDDGIPYSDIREAANQRAQGLTNVDPEAMAAAGLTNLIELAREVRVATLVQDVNQYSAGRHVALAGTDQLDDYTNSDPYAVIDTAINGTLVFRANTITMGYPVWSKLKQHPKLIKAVKGGLTDEGAITKDQFADLFEIARDRFLVGEAMVNTAKKGQAAVISRLWGKNIIASYVDPSKQTPTDGVMTHGFTAELGTKLAGNMEDKDIGIEGGTRVRVGEKVKETVCAADLGYLVQTAIS